MTLTQYSEQSTPLAHRHVPLTYFPTSFSLTSHSPPSSPPTLHVKPSLAMPTKCQQNNPLSKWSYGSPSLQGRRGRDLVWAVFREILFTNEFSHSFENLHLLLHLTLEFISIASWCLSCNFQFTSYHMCAEWLAHAWHTVGT